jgi:hypothetical protein
MKEESNACANRLACWFLRGSIPKSFIANNLRNAIFLGFHRGRRAAFRYAPKRFILQQVEG